MICGRVEKYSDLKINVNLRNMVILKTIDSSDLTISRVHHYNPDMYAAEHYFMNTTDFPGQANEWKEKQNFGQIDFIFIFTRFKLNIDGVLGESYLCYVCDPVYGGVVLVRMTKNVAQTAAHEMAHNLGARHDGHNGCENENGLMAAVNSAYSDTTIKHAFDFTECAIRDILDCVNGHPMSEIGNEIFYHPYDMARGCVLSAPVCPASFTVPAVGVPLSQEEQCSLAMDNGLQLTNMVSICAPYNQYDEDCLIRCYDGVTYCKQIIADDGTPCKINNQPGKCYSGYGCLEDAMAVPSETCMNPTTCNNCFDKPFEGWDETCDEIAYDYPDLFCNDYNGDDLPEYLRDVCRGTATRLGLYMAQGDADVPCNLPYSCFTK